MNQKIELPEIEKGVKLFADRFAEIGINGVKQKAPDDQVEKAQERYLALWILILLKSSNIPKEKKLEVLEYVKEKVNT